MAGNACMFEMGVHTPHPWWWCGWLLALTWGAFLCGRLSVKLESQRDSAMCQVRPSGGADGLQILQGGASTAPEVCAAQLACETKKYE